MLLAVQLQPEPAVTLMVPVPPGAEKPAVVGVIEYVQLEAAWEAVKLCPATVNVAERELVLVLAATE